MNESTPRAGSADDAAFCANLVRERDFSRYAVTLFAPQDKRRALLALYAFNAEISHVRDHVSQPLPGEMRLQWWSDLIDGHDHGDVAGNPVAAELMRTVANHDLSRDVLRGLIEAHIFDVYDDPMPTRDALETYCHDTSSALFALSARILGGDSDKCEHAARQAGVAQGIADIIALIPLHAARRQIYLPRDLLDQHGATEANVFAGRITPQLAQVVEGLRAEAVSCLDVADDLLAGVPETALPAFLPLALVRQALSRPAGNVFEPSRMSHLATLWTLWRASRAKPFRA
ncbi:MAG: squalene/phytoene synthase family protein [Bradyrhizobiaceae bacterium]|nr:MAG: squalene/phytoene synthase family protein [Bradyrhizobiaceae bacterium]